MGDCGLRITDRIDVKGATMAMSNEHKAALARGRREARAIKAYLRAVSARRPGRPVTTESLTARLNKIEDQLTSTSDPLQRVDLLQRRIDVNKSLEATTVKVDMDSLEREFAGSVGGYSERKGITYAAWREAGVPAAVLRRAGLRRGG